MIPKDQNSCALMLRALDFSARRHQDQRRKDHKATPYINHPIAVAYIITNIGGVHDLPTVMAAILHDTIEDTATTAAELEEEFGARVRAIVEEVTDDKRLPKERRKQLQIEHAATASQAARCVKLADKIANLQDLANSPPAGWALNRKREYVEWSEAVINRLRGTNAALERHFDEVCRNVKSHLDRGA